MNIAEARSNTASPAVLAWSIILQTLRETVLSRKEARELRQSMKAINGFEEEATETEVDSSTTDTGESRSRRRQSGDSDLSLQPTVYDEVLQAVSSHRLKEDSIRFLARSAGGDCQVFDIIINLVSNYEACFGSDGITGTCNEVRLLLLELIQSSVQAVEYLPDVVLATLAVLTTRKTAQALDPATMFLNDAVLMGNTFKAAISRFPYEIIPFLRLLRALSTSREVDTEGTLKATTILEEMKTFTQALPIGFEDYTTTYEDRNENFVRLIRTLDVFEQRTSQGLIPIEDKALVSKDHSFVIPMDTLGRIVTDQKPAVGLWCIEYSGLYYLGRLLQTGLSGSNTVDHGTGKPLDHDSTAEIIGLLTDLMTNSIQANGDRAAAQGILEEASDGLEQTSDIITVIFDIFEEHLESHIQDRSTDVLSNCMDFISALIQILPGRVWPFLARSSLLEIDGTGGNLVAVVAGSEMPFGRFDFLLASIRVYDGLVEDAVVHAVARKTIQTGRHNRPEVLEAGVPDQVVKKVLDAFQRIMVDVLQNSSNWKFVSNDDRHRLCESLLTTFDRVLFYCYAIDDTADSQTKVTGVLASAAEYILDVYLSSGNDVPVDQLLEMISAGTMTPSTTLFPRSLSLWISQVSTALEFATSLVQLRRLTDRQPSYLEAQLFDTAPVLVRIYVGHFSYRMPVLNLLRRLVLAAADSSEPPSLLGHLGPDTAKDFLEILSRLDAPLDDGDVYNGIWDLLSAVVSGGQQWFSVYLLTGKTPRGTLKDQRGTDKLARPMLQAALDAATLTLSSSKNLAILKFIARSVDCWPWSINDLRKHPSFITTTIKYVDELQPPSGSQTDAQNLQTCEQISIAALAAQILAMYNHFSRQMGDSSATKTVSHHIRYYVENAVNLPNYNLSLHGNLKRNFEMKYSCMLSSFKKTHFTRQILGRDFFYDTEIADKMLSFDEAWHGKRGNNGLALEVQKANINLSIVQSQVVSILDLRPLYC
jgi:nuclear pore complex protein Nup188